MLVLRQGSFDEYRATQNVQDKAQFAGNGCSIDKGCNAVLNVLGGSLRASREAAIRGVTPLGDGATIPREARLAASRFPARCIHQSYLDGVLVQRCLNIYKHRWWAALTHEVFSHPQNPKASFDPVKSD